jgi:hypothetical protein
VEPPHPPGKRSLWDRIGLKVVIILVPILVSIVLIFMWVWANMTTLEPYGAPYIVSMGTVVDYDEQADTFTIYVESSSGDPQGLLNLNDVSVRLEKSNRTKIREYVLGDILDHQGSDITYYDTDKNELLSVGDEFSIEGGIVEPGSKFLIINKRYGRVVINVDLN